MITLEQFFRSPLQAVRANLLRRKNRLAIRRTVKRAASMQGIPLFVIASPADMHLTPWFFNAFDGHQNFYVIANGIDVEGVNWLRSKLPNSAITSLAASLTGNRRTFLGHGEVIDLIAYHCDGDFFICDADCLITDIRWLQQTLNPPSNAYAMGPFGKDAAIPGIRMPDTFLVLLNLQKYKTLCREFGIDARITKTLTDGLQSKILAKYGIRISQPEAGKNYVDTLQQYWMAADVSQLIFHEIPGAGETFFHIGGSSYLLSNSHTDLTHWDYWPANTIYFHLKFLETANEPFLADKLRSLTARYGSSAAFLEANAGLRKSGRFQETLRVLAFLFPGN